MFFCWKLDTGNWKLVFMTTQLEYAPPRKFGRKRFRRARNFLLILLLIAATIWFLGVPLYNKCRMLYWQRQCMNHLETGVSKNTGPPALPPATLDAYREFLSDPRLPAPSSTDTRHAYLHAVQSPAGPRLAYAFVRESIETFFTTSLPGYSTYSTKLVVCIIEPGTLFSPPKVLSRTEFTSAELDYFVCDYRIDPDPADDSAFTITLSGSPDIPPNYVNHFRMTGGDSVIAFERRFVKQSP
jgi:hypothetical protein